MVLYTLRPKLHSSPASEINIFFKAAFPRNKKEKRTLNIRKVYTNLHDK